MKNFWVTFPPSPKCRKIRVFSDFIATQQEKKELFLDSKSVYLEHLHRSYLIAACYQNAF
jgi:hypothetical protein